MKKIYLFAVIFALLAGVCTYFFVTGLQNNSKVTGVLKADVVIAIQDIEKNTPVTREMFRVVNLPVDSITYGTATNINDLIGYVAVDNIYKGEQVLVSKLSLMGEDADTKRLSYNLADGSFAYTMTVGEENSIAFFLREGDFVDIYGYGSTAKWIKLLENVEVLKTGTYSDSIQEDVGVEITAYGLLTLKLTAEQLEVLQNGNTETGEVSQFRIVLVPYVAANEITTVPPETMTDEFGNSFTVDIEHEPATNYGMGDIAVTTTVAASG